jgi:holo-[acyl-carrier protein] synthase
VSQVVGIGCEIVECLRIAQMVNRHGELFIHRVYTQAEVTYCNSRKAATQQFAAHWAGKEAVLKSLGLGFRPGIRFREIELVTSPDGITVARTSGAVLEHMRRMGVERILVTLGHCRTHATGYVVALSGNGLSHRTPTPLH